MRGAPLVPLVWETYAFQWASRVHGWVYDPWATAPDLTAVWLDPQTPDRRHGHRVPAPRPLGPHSRRPSRRHQGAPTDRLARRPASTSPGVEAGERLNSTPDAQVTGDRRSG